VPGEEPFSGRSGRIEQGTGAWDLQRRSGVDERCGLEDEDRDVDCDSQFHPDVVGWS
jgi:hypothetical protein